MYKTISFRKTEEVIRVYLFLLSKKKIGKKEEVIE